MKIIYKTENYADLDLVVKSWGTWVEFSLSGPSDGFVEWSNMCVDISRDDVGELITALMEWIDEN